MTTIAARRLTRLDWTRIAGWSSSVAAHVAALLVLAAPMAFLPTHAPPPVVTARWIEPDPPPIVLPEPPPPAVPRRPRTTPVPVHRAPVETHVDRPVESTMPPTETTQDPGPVAPTNTAGPETDIGDGSGTTQALAYATPLRPEYPIASKRAREQGTVVLRVLVDADGAPQRIELERSSGHPRLDAAAKDSVSHARFRPVLRNGAPVAAWGIVPIAFRLDQV